MCVSAPPARFDDSDSSDDWYPESRKSSSVAHEAAAHKQEVSAAAQSKVFDFLATNKIRETALH